MAKGSQWVSTPQNQIVSLGTVTTGVWEAEIIEPQFLSGVWKTAGNASTTAGTDFVGTTDLQDLVFKTNALERLRILSTGNVGVGSTIRFLANVQANSPGFALRCSIIS